ncbi:MAG: dephospho-CoA kinase [Clostridiales bacterium]|nr:dephospho-CoA kinase [Clostridiales bacterium]
MKFIGITGGVGAGKSQVLEYLKNKPRVRVMLADEIAHDLMEPGTECYREILREFGTCIAGESTGDTKEGASCNTGSLCQPDGHFDRAALSSVIFSDGGRRQKMNAIVHPAVKEFVQQECDKERRKGEIDFLFLEAALLVEEGYGDICDELWYIYADESVRRRRLKSSRGYTDERIDGILKSQLSEKDYRKSCPVTIDNGGDLLDTYTQVDRQLDRYV